MFASAAKPVNLRRVSIFRPLRYGSYNRAPVRACAGHALLGTSACAGPAGRQVCATARVGIPAFTLGVTLYAHKTNKLKDPEYLTVFGIFYREYEWDSRVIIAVIAVLTRVPTSNGYPSLAHCDPNEYA